MFTDVPLLSLIIWVPIIGGIICMFAGDDRKATRARCIALLTAFINLLLCCAQRQPNGTYTYAFNDVN